MIILEEKQKRYEQEKIKREKYNPDNIFKNKNKQETTNIKMQENDSNTKLIEYKESFFTKFKNFIHRILPINKKTN